MNVSDSDLEVLLLCDVCDGAIALPDDIGERGCCTACGIAYVFDGVEARAAA